MPNSSTFRHLRAAGIALALAGVGVGPSAPSAQAAVLVSLDLPQLVEQSDLVIVAKAQKQSSRYVDKLIVTDVSLQVITSLKGSARPGDIVTVTHLGGSVGEVGLQVPGAAAFKLGESAVVFLRRVPSGDLNVTGMSQGVMPIKGQGAEQQVIPGGKGAELMQRTDDGRLLERPAQPQQPRSLTDVVSEIERLVGRR